MYNRKKKIIDSLYKLLCIYEDNDFDHYYSFLSSLIINIEGHKRYYYKTQQMNSVYLLTDVITSLDGLFERKEKINQKQVKNVSFHHANRLDKELIDNEIL